MNFLVGNFNTFPVQTTGEIYSKFIIKSPTIYWSLLTWFSEGIYDTVFTLKETVQEHKLAAEITPKIVSHIKCPYMLFTADKYHTRPFFRDIYSAILLYQWQQPRESYGLWPIPPRRELFLEFSVTPACCVCVSVCVCVASLRKSPSPPPLGSQCPSPLSVLLLPDGLLCQAGNVR